MSTSYIPHNPTRKVPRRTRVVVLRKPVTYVSTRTLRTRLAKTGFTSDNPDLTASNIASNRNTW